MDDVNLQRFLDLVAEFRRESQLIVVSHQRRTMESADVLYGVSMPPGGSSVVLSERPSQAAALIAAGELSGPERPETEHRREPADGTSVACRPVGTTEILVIVVVVVVATVLLASLPFIHRATQRRSKPSAPGAPVAVSPPAAPQTDDPVAVQAPPPATFASGLASSRRTLRDRLASISRRQPDATTWESLEEALLGADVGVETTMATLERLRTQGQRPGHRGRRRPDACAH